MPLLPDSTDSSDRTTPGLRTHLRSAVRVAAGVLGGLWILVVAIVLFVLLYAGIGIVFGQPWSRPVVARKAVRCA